MLPFPNTLQDLLNKRLEAGSLRTLSINNNLIDFCSNDYLGLAKNTGINASLPNGSGGSRLLSGNTILAEETEFIIADFHHTESALVFNSGYDANVGLFSSVPQQGDTVIYDELIHASIHDGRRLSHAQSFMFRHNDLEHLETRLQQASGNIYVAIESVYSMDGDFAPLESIVSLCNEYNAYLIIDEAHATGVFGVMGEGLVQHFGLENQVFARIHTFGKALGCHGAAIVGSEALRNFLINYARSFIYTTALTPHNFDAIQQAYKNIVIAGKERSHLADNIILFKGLLNAAIHNNLIESNSPIQCIVVEGNDKVKELAALIQQNGFDVRPVLSPTVPKGKERLRICLHSFNTAEEITELCLFLNKQKIFGA